MLKMSSAVNRPPGGRQVLLDTGASDLFLKNAGLLDCFSVLVTGDMVRRSKPDPEIFLRACEGLGVTPEQALVIEDSFNGVRAAYAGGIRVLMVPDLLAPDGEMRQKAEAILPTLFEVREYLLK